MADETKDSPETTGAGAPEPSAPAAPEAAAAAPAEAPRPIPRRQPTPPEMSTFKDVKPAAKHEAAKPEAKPAGEKPAAAAAASAAPAAEKPAPKPTAAPAAAAAPVAAKPAAPAAAKPAAAKPAAAADMTRRGFFSWAAVAWVGFAAAIGGCATAMGRFMFPNVLFEPPTSFKAGKPEDYQAGVVDTGYVDQYGVWIVNDQGRIFALIAICTHLGCPPAWLDAQNKFKCPCHGSGYYKSGVNFEGPTPRPLERAKITVSPDDGRIVVDKAQKFQWELGQWDDPSSFIPA